MERYCASLIYELDEILEKGNEIIGIDLGTEGFAALSNGIRIEEPISIKREEKRIKRTQKKLAKKKKDGKK
ncbi:transposase [Thermoplasma volcanium]|uniref:transposase n=1 Tax=Thermoplasma volcanium TaxID=50339 RepID=UPI0000164DBD|nr:transposase [Thermoplasma volcanium]